MDSSEHGPASGSTPPTPRELRAARRRAHEEEKKKRAKKGGGKGDMKSKGGGDAEPSVDEPRRR